MNRRSFLSMMGFVAPAIIVKPTYFLAPVKGWGPIPAMMVESYGDYMNVMDFDLGEPVLNSYVGIIHPFFVADLLNDLKTSNLVHATARTLTRLNAEAA
jgi:hypothetical protein